MTSRKRAVPAADDLADDFPALSLAEAPHPT